MTKIIFNRMMLFYMLRQVYADLEMCFSDKHTLMFFQSTASHSAIHIHTLVQTQPSVGH